MPKVVAAYGISLAALAAALLLRWLLRPVLGDDVPFVTIFAAVAASVWFGGHRPAIVAAALGYVASAYLFVEPRGVVIAYDSRNLIRLLLYTMTCAIIIVLGEATRVARRRFDELVARQVEATSTTVEAIRRRYNLREIGLLGFGMIAVIFVAGILLGTLNVRRLSENERQVAHAHEVIGQLETVLATLTDAETGQRGYFLTHDQRYLEPYDHALSRLHATVNHVEELTADQPDQRAGLALLEQAIAVKLEELRRTLDLARRGHRSAALAVVRSDAGRAAMDEARRIVAGMRRTEEETLRRHADEADATLRATILSTVVPGVLGLGLVGLVFSLNRRNLRVRQRDAEVLTEQRERLRVTLASIGDAVITTDAEGRLTYQNAVAESLTGWTHDEAEGKPLDAVFRIVNEQTRRAAESPVTRVLRDGAVVGLANHTVLVRKDGTEIPIDDSASPIRSEGGTLLGCVLVFRDVTERRRDDAQRAQLAAIVASSEDAIVGATLDGIITSWNRGAERTFGYAAEEMIGKPFTVLAPPELRDDYPRILETVGQGTPVEHFQTQRLRKDGRRIHVSVTISPIRDAEGRIIGTSKVARDVTERVQADEERETLLAIAERARAQAEAAAAAEHRAREIAEAASRAKDSFLATISHELRTPLSPILTWARMLQQPEIAREQLDRGLEVIERSARSQAQLIEDLLDVSRIVSGKMRLEVRPVPLASVIEKAVEIVQPAADAKSVRLHVVLDTQVGAVSGDAERLQQVVWNLLSNAVKFTPKGGRVQVVLERVNSHVEIAVSDTGQGIAPDFLPFVFERFRQADASSSRMHGGLGLGLAIVRHIVEAHGGTIHAESPGPGQGAVFTVKLPLMAPRTAGEAERRHPTLAAFGDGGGALPHLDGVRVLIVDDEPDSNEAVGNLLASCGAEVRTAISADHARSTLDEWRPDVLVSDVGMPGEDGYALIAKLRARTDAAGRVPAVALTAYASREDKVRLLSAGFQAHVPKPLDPAELLAVVASLARGVARF